MQFPSTVSPGCSSSRLIWLVVACFCCCSAAAAAAADLVSEKAVLLQLKSSVSDPAGILSSWIVGNASDDLEHCSWYGVSCGPDSRVSALTIVGGGVRADGGNSVEVPCFDVSKFPFYGFGIRRSCSARNGRLIGKLPSLIAKLSEIRVLSLPFNELGGEIPVEIWGLEKLEVLDLEGNSFVGHLPLSFGGLRKLRVLNLGLNGIGGIIPDSLSKCVDLETLNLGGNEFKGLIPKFIGRFSVLSRLYLSSNLLKGNLPVELAHNCQNLEFLDLSGNMLTGEILSNLGNCKRLKALLFFSNQLKGVIPSSFGQLTKLQLLDVSRNKLNGLIPAELGHCTDLSVLVLSNPYDPPAISKYAGKDPIDNAFEGSIPMEITSLTKLKVLWAPAASLSGDIPRKWGKSLEVINLAENFFTGGIVGVFESSSSLVYANLSANMLTGELDEKIPVSCAVVFDVSMNMLYGSIPRFINGVCNHVVPQASHLVLPDLPFLAYRSFFIDKKQEESLALEGKISVIHNFGQNNFTGVIPSLPIAHSSLGRKVDYTFLADGNRLTGSFPGRVFDSCHKLNALFVKVNNNKLSGQLPVGLSVMCRSLKYLDASGNEISGFIPRNLGNSKSLVLLGLNQKKVHMKTPMNLGRLNHLYYSSAPLGIKIAPADVNSKNLIALVLNSNNPSTQIHYGQARRSLIDQDLQNCGKTYGSCHMLNSSSPSYTEDAQYDSTYPSTQESTDEGENSNSFNSIEIASVVSASAIVLVLLALIVLFIYTRKYAPKGGSRVGDLEKKEITLFADVGAPLTFQNIVKATEYFSTRNCIGSGGFGTTYRAEVSPGVPVAVKRLAVGRVHCVQQFHAEIKTLGRIKHNNLVTLIGYHASETEMFLIYNYLPGGNLEKFIQDRSTRPVSWKVLHRIALDVAYALAYLHDCDPRVIHRDVKPSNILLDNDFRAYLSDFGLSRLLGNSETHATTGVEGTFGYLAPEYAMTCRVSEKVDVYSYGVVLLELLSDKKALDPSFSTHGDGFNIVSWACLLLRQGRAKEVFTVGLWDVGPRDDLVEVLHLAVKCTLDSLTVRPTMKQVVQRLKQLRPVS